MSAHLRGLLLVCSAYVLVSCDQFRDPYARAKEKARQRAASSKWRVGTAALEKENQIRIKLGIRCLDARWKLESVRDRGASGSADHYESLGDVYGYVCDDKYGSEIKAVCRDVKTGRLIADLDTYPSGHRYDSEVDGPSLEEHLFAAFTFASRQYDLVSYMGSRSSIERQAEVEPMTPRRLNDIVVQMRR